MKKQMFLLALYLCMHVVVYSQNTASDDVMGKNDSLNRMRFLADEVVVRSIRANEKTPVNQSLIQKSEIQKNNLGQDLPYLLDMTPSIVTSSDAGAGVGYTNMRIRGTDGSRINVTMNGIPMNDAESHGVFWVDLPDIASSVDNIQIQRGIGTSSLGSSAFGATINLQTTGINSIPYSEITNTIGSFRTMKNSVSFGSGLINEHITFDGRLSKVSSDGYIDRASSDLQSYYLSGSYYDKKTLFKLNVFSGTEKTYQAWNGVSGDSLKTNRTYNELGAYTDDNGNVKYFDNQTDNYVQTHYQGIFAHQFSNELNFNANVHYTRGLGFYEEYKLGQNLTDYKLKEINGKDTITKTDLIRRLWLDNHFYGATWAISYNENDLSASIGGGWNRYDGEHYGKVRWAKYMSNGNIDHQYYYSDGFKTDFSVYAKASYQINDYVSFFGDLQYRAINQEMEGKDKKQRNISQKHDFQFFNPKAGFTLSIDENNSFLGYIGVANREPTRDNFVDADTTKALPTSERLTDYEFGYTYKNKGMRFGANFYYMNYKNQLVLTGEINDVGAAVMSNVEKSYRTGLELTGGIQITKTLTWTGNVTISRNIITNFTSYTDNWDYWNDPTTEPLQISKNMGSRKIAFSPEIVASNQLTYSVLKQLDIVLINKYIGKQYIDNTENEALRLNDYSLTNVRFNFHVKTQYVRNIDVLFQLNNIFDAKYESNAWAYSYYENAKEKSMVGYYPQAGINFLTGLVLKF